jgi:hypothetical protein
MKVYIGPYYKWWGVYQTVDLLQKVGVSEKTCEDIGDWICENTPAEDFFNWIHELKGERKIKVHIDDYDTWSMDNTLAHIILPMLKQLKATKHGSPLVDDEDLPAHMRHTLSKGLDDYETDDRWIHYKWDWVLNEMIWAFEQELDDSWEDQFRHGVPDYEFIHVGGEIGTESEMNEMIQTNPDYWVDRDGIKEYNNRINNGFKLFGKYYRNLWD